MTTFQTLSNLLHTPPFKVVAAIDTDFRRVPQLTALYCIDYSFSHLPSWQSTQGSHPVRSMLLRFTLLTFLASPVNTLILQRDKSIFVSVPSTLFAFRYNIPIIYLLIDRFMIYFFHLSLMKDEVDVVIMPMVAHWFRCVALLFSPAKDTYYLSINLPANFLPQTPLQVCFGKHNWGTRLTHLRTPDG